MRDDVAAGRRRLHQSDLSDQCVKPPASGVDNAASPDWQTPANGIISPSITVCLKTTGRTKVY